MEKRNFITVFLGITLLLLSLFAASFVLGSASQETVYRFDAKGGIPGAPEKTPKPPEETAIEYELFIEIDYMLGHEPTASVLTYIHDYYYARGIDVTFYVDELVDDPTLDTGVTDDDFWNIEAAYNDHDEGYYSKWKWVLFGTTVEGESNIAGYTYAMLSIRYVPSTGRILKVDSLAGNYIFIADEGTDDWATTLELEIGAEATVLMHELGHSIGITKVGSNGNIYTGFSLWEIYDSDTSSVMSYLTTANAGLYEAWYYSNEYWKLRNIEYYKI